MSPRERLANRRASKTFNFEGQWGLRFTATVRSSKACSTDTAKRKGRRWSAGQNFNLTQRALEAQAL
jgi:hypothetical protein